MFVVEGQRLETLGFPEGDGPDVGAIDTDVHALSPMRRRKVEPCVKQLGPDTAALKARQEVQVNMRRIVSNDDGGGIAPIMIRRCGSTNSRLAAAGCAKAFRIDPLAPGLTWRGLARA